MSRRRPKGELQFGSDSFLDVVANIVGILIILIVIAGLRVSQTPVMIHRQKVVPEETPSTPSVPMPLVAAVLPPPAVIADPVPAFAPTPTV